MSSNLNKKLVNSPLIPLARNGDKNEPQRYSSVLQRIDSQETGVKLGELERDIRDAAAKLLAERTALEFREKKPR